MSSEPIPTLGQNRFESIRAEVIRRREFRAGMELCPEPFEEWLSQLPRR